MADNYNVDDILAEINSKRQRENIRNNPPKKQVKKENNNVPFRLSGMTEEFSAPKVNNAKRKEEEYIPPSRKTSAFKEPQYQEPGYHEPRRKEPKKNAYFDEDDLDFTLTMEIDTASSERRLQYEKGRTVVLPKVRELNKQLKNDRQEKIRQFMENSDFEDEFLEDDGFSFGDKEKDEFKKTLGLKKHPVHQSEEDEEQLDERVSKAEKRKKRKKHSEDYSENNLNEDFEYTSPSDNAEIVNELAGMKKSCLIKLAVTGTVFVVLLYLSLCNLYPLPLISFICPENNMRVFLLVNLFVFLCSAMVKSSDIASGLVSFFTLKSNNDSPAAIATLAVIIQGTYSAFKNDSLFTGEGYLYFAVAGLILFMNSFGKLLTVNRVEKNFKTVTDSKDLRGEYVIEDSSLAYSLSEGQGFTEANITYGKRVKFPSDFISLSFSDNYFEQSGKIIAPLFVLFGFIISAISYFLFEDFNSALTVFTSVMCMASPLTATTVAALPLYKASGSLSSDGSFVSGYNSVDKFEDANGILVDARELYKQEDVILHGIKVFGDMRIDKSLVEAASLMYASNGLLKQVFLDTLEGRISMLQKVTDLKSYKGGIGGMCQDTEVIMGSRELMEKFFVPLPSREYEQKFLKDDGKVIFLAANGNLEAMIVVSYSPSEDALKYLEQLGKYAPAIIVRSDDPNIDAEKISSDFDYPEEYIKMVEPENYKRVDEIGKGSEMGRAYAMVSGTGSRLRLIAALVALKKNITSATVLQVAGLIIGYAMVALMAFTGNLKMLGFLQIMIYQVFWAACISMQGALGKY